MKMVCKLILFSILLLALPASAIELGAPLGESLQSMPASAAGAGFISLPDSQVSRTWQAQETESMSAWLFDESKLVVAGNLSEVSDNVSIAALGGVRLGFGANCAT